MSKLLIKPMANHESKYYALSNGRIWSRKRLVKAKNNSFAHRGGYWIRGALSVQGYKVTTINSQQQKIHRLIAQTFIPNPENKPCINHKDGNKLNNDISNLEWVTYQENAIHASINGLAVKGELNGRSKLTEKQVKEMRFHHKATRKRGEKTWEQYNISKKYYFNVVNDINWNYL